LGYIFFSKKFPKKTIIDYKSFIREGKPKLEEELKETVNKILDCDDIDELQYDKNDDKIYDLLLALNVFRNEGGRFNFTLFDGKAWTLEHIFPQTPDELDNKLDKEDILFLRSLCDNKLGDFGKVKDELREYEEMINNIENVFNSLTEKMSCETCTLASEEKIILYRIIKSEKLQSIGNMALLTGPDNSSNGNGMFDKKRKNIVKRISEGSFVPKHTYDVFSKLILDIKDGDLKAWKPADIDAHFEWIKNQINKIKNSGIA